MDAARFVRQSRPRLLIVGVREDRAVPETLTRSQPDSLWHPANLLGCLRQAGAAIEECLAVVDSPGDSAAQSEL